MPTVKQPKTPKQHPPCNRAFALRMMHPTQYTEGRISPLDRALKPIKDSFKRAGSKSKKKDKLNSQTNENSDFDSSFEVASPSEDVNLQRDLLERANNKTRRSPRDQEDDAEQQRNDATRKHHQRSDRHQRVHHHRNNDEPNSYDGPYSAMENIYEEDEIDYYNQHQNHHQNHYDENGRMHERNGNHHESRDNRMMRSNEITNHVDADHDESMMFVTSKGDVVKLRRKHARSSSAEAAEQQHASPVIDEKRAERFGKRLSLLCHMLAEKYPEDFHILELLVELQVSNEKREGEMNQSLTKLQSKVEYLEERMNNFEKLSISGFQKSLLPLVDAFGSFYDGLKESVHNVEIDGGNLKKCDDMEQAKDNEKLTSSYHKDLDTEEDEEEGVTSEELVIKAFDSEEDIESVEGEDKKCTEEEEVGEEEGKHDGEKENSQTNLKEDMMNEYDVIQDEDGGEKNDEIVDGRDARYENENSEDGDGEKEGKKEAGTEERIEEITVEEDIKKEEENSKQGDNFTVNEVEDVAEIGENVIDKQQERLCNDEKSSDILEKAVVDEISSTTAEVLKPHPEYQKSMEINGVKIASETSV
eukprot:gene12369-13639_t